MPWGNSYHCPVIPSVPAEFVHLINLPALESSSSVQKLSWALPALSAFYPTVGTAAFTPGVWQSLRCPQNSSGTGAWEGITCGGAKSFCCCCFFKWWFPTPNATLLKWECLTKCHYPTPLLPGDFHPPNILTGSVHVEKLFLKSSRKWQNGLYTTGQRISQISSAISSWQEHVEHEGWVTMGMEKQERQECDFGRGQYRFIGKHRKLIKLHLKADFSPQSLSRCCCEISLLLSEQRSPEYTVKSHTTAIIN